MRDVKWGRAVAPIGCAFQRCPFIEASLSVLIVITVISKFVRKSAHIKYIMHGYVILYAWMHGRILRTHVLSMTKHSK